MNPMDLKRGVSTLRWKPWSPTSSRNSKKVTSNEEIAQVGNI